MTCLNIKIAFSKHIDELRIALSNQCVDILAINETKLDGSICDNEVTVVGYNRGILVYNVCLISISNSISDGATNKSVLNIEKS